MLTVQVNEAVVLVGVVRYCTTVTQHPVMCHIDSIIPLTDNTSMNILFTFTKDTLTTRFGHLECRIEEQHIVTVGNDTALVLTLKRFDAEAFTVQIKVYINSHDVSFQE
jgi:hypothetical protein